MLNYKTCPALAGFIKYKIAIDSREHRRKIEFKHYFYTFLYLSERSSLQFLYYRFILKVCHQSKLEDQRIKCDYFRTKLRDNQIK